MHKEDKKKQNQRIKNRKRNSVKFSDKVHPAKGILSFTFGMLAASIFIVTSFLSYRAKGNAGAGIGFFGILAFVFSIAGVVLSILALRGKDIHYRYPVLGGLLCGVLVLGYFIMYIMGAML